MRGRSNVGPGRYSPTVHTSVEEEAETSYRLAPGAGSAGTTIHLDPSQCSVNTVGACPTAHASVQEMSSTALRVPCVAGFPTFLHRLPSQCLIIPALPS